jgi:hypothetical protein
MADDALTLLLRTLEEPVPVRQAFAEDLRRILHAELGFAPPVEAVAAVPPLAVSRRPSILDRVTGALRPMTPRMALLIALTLLLLACTAAGAWAILHGWVSSGPRGPQFTDDFTFAEVYREQGTSLLDLQAGPGGETLYALRSGPHSKPGEGAAVVRLRPGGAGLTAETVIELEAFRDPAAWPPGTDLSAGAIVPGTATIAREHLLSVARNGDLFVNLGLSADPQRTPDATTIAVAHPDGSVARALSIGDLVDAGLMEGSLRWPMLTATASAPDRLWARAQGNRPGGEDEVVVRLFEVIDPNADGDWADRVVLPLVLPDEIPPMVTGSWEWVHGGFVAEPSIPGRDRSASALLAVHSAKDEYRIYRLHDPDADGNVAGSGDTELVFTGQLTDPDYVVEFPALAPRVVGQGQPGVDELLAAGLTRNTRISRITPTGVVDIARAVGSTFGVAATADGAIYVVMWERGPGNDPDNGFMVVERLTPVPVGASAPAPAPPTSADAVASPGAAQGSPASGPSEGASPAASAESLLEHHPLTPGVPRIAAWYGGMVPSGDFLNDLVFLGVDGSGPETLLPGTYNQGLCPSADGEWIAFWSDEDVPNESYLYVDRVGGGSRTLVTEAANMIMCPFPAGKLVTLAATSAPWRLTWHDLAGGGTREVVPDVSTDGVLDASRDGAWIAVASGAEGRTITIVDVGAGEARPLVTGLAARVVRAAWSFDGGRLAYATGPYDPMNPDTTGTFEVWVTDREGGAARRLASVTGRPPTIAWSPDGRSISVIDRSGESTCCEPPGTLRVIDTRTGSSEVIGKDVTFAGWSPVDPGTFAWATKAILYIREGDAAPREIPGPTGKLCDACSDRKTPSWPFFGLGWSPDGRYIGTGDMVTGVVDVETGAYRVLLTDGDEQLVEAARWWP